MPKYKLTIEYDGSPFCGWQQQAAQPSVQQSIAEAILKFCGEKVTVNGAGRTDTGVHATGQVAHIILSKAWPLETIKKAVNFHLKPLPVAILDVEEVANEFDARFSAIKRYYRYDLIYRQAPLTFNKGLIWQIYYPLDIELMHQEAQCLVGKHDFTTFRASHCQSKSPVKTIDKITVTENAGLISIHVEALSFLHNQIRSITGCLKDIGTGRWEQGRLEQALLSAKREECAAIAPPHGLYLTRVDYPH